MADDHKWKKISIDIDCESKIPDQKINKAITFKNNIERHKFRKQKLAQIKGGLGVGSYGLVYKKGNYAIKQFEKLNHIIQEWIVLKYLSDCTYVVKSPECNFYKKEIALQLYDSSVSTYIKTQNPSFSQRMKIIECVLSGLVEMHIRGLTHGDIKPSNMLVNYKDGKLFAVLADFGFSSVSKYSKVEYTSPIYQEPRIDHICGPEHDMYSFGLSCIEILTGKTVSPKLDDGSNDWTYDAINKVSYSYMKNYSCWKTIKKMLDENYETRITSEEALEEMFKTQLYPWSWHSSMILKKNSKNCNSENKTTNIFRRKARSIHRSKIGSVALNDFFENKEEYMDLETKKLYIKATLFILYSIFRGDRCEIQETPLMIKIINDLLNNERFINQLMRPSVK